ncbi:hypothetical protein VTK26DRAFT_1809 [Humicola hyalothermophila]
MRLCMGCKRTATLMEARTRGTVFGLSRLRTKRVEMICRFGACRFPLLRFPVTFEFMEVSQTSTSAGIKLRESTPRGGKVIQGSRRPIGPSAFIEAGVRSCSSWPLGQAERPYRCCTRLWMARFQIAIWISCPRHFCRVGRRSWPTPSFCHRLMFPAEGTEDEFLSV